MAGLELADSFKKLEADVVQKLEERYYLIPRNKLWAFVGGAVAFLVAIGVIGYQSVWTAVRSTGVAAVGNEIRSLRNEADGHVAALRAAAARWPDVPKRIEQLETRTKAIDGTLASVEKKTHALDISALRANSKMRIKSTYQNKYFLAVGAASGALEVARSSPSDLQWWVLLPAQ